MGLPLLLLLEQLPSSGHHSSESAPQTWAHWSARLFHGCVGRLRLEIGRECGDTRALSVSTPELGSTRFLWRSTPRVMSQVGEQLSADLDRPGTALFGASEPLPSPSPPASLTSMPSPSPPPSPLRPLESVPTEDKDGRRTLGALRFQLIRLVEAMVKLNSSDVDVALSKHDILPACLRLFFDFPFHSMMHRSVTAIVLTILDGDDVRAGEDEGDASARAASESHTSPHVILQRQLIENATLQRKILDAYERNREAEKLPKGRRDGYMGHLNQMSCAICKVSGESSRSAVSAMVAKSSVAAEWRAFVLSTLAAQTAFQCRPLGGFEFPRRMDESPNELADENDNDAMFSSESM